MSILGMEAYQMVARTMGLRCAPIKRVFWKSGMLQHEYPMGAERATFVSLEAVPLREKPLKRWLSLNNVCFSRGLFARSRPQVVLGVTEANRLGPDYACRTAELAANGTVRVRPGAGIFRVHIAAQPPVAKRGHIPER